MYIKCFINSRRFRNIIQICIVVCNSMLKFPLHEDIWGRSPCRHSPGWILSKIRLSAPAGYRTPVIQVLVTVHLQVSIDLPDYGLKICTYHWRNQCGMFGIRPSAPPATNGYILVYSLRQHSVGNVVINSAYLGIFSLDSVSGNTFWEEQCYELRKKNVAAAGGAPICGTSRHS